jgi:D-3-phosphoglycerate dehydrogenase
MSYTVLVTAPDLAPAGMQRLEESQCRVLFVQDAGNTEALEHLMASAPIDAVISRTVTLSGKAIAACPSLKVISKHGVGVNNIDVDAASARGIPVFVTPGANAQSVAELTLGLMFAAARKITWMDGQLREGRWSRVQNGLQMQGRTIGLVGFGQVAQRVAVVCMALGMRVLAFDTARRNGRPISQVAFVASLDALLAESDVLSLHVPLTAQTRGMIGAAQLALLPQGAIVINTARGECIDEQALIEALQAGHLFAAGLDTMALEPLPADSALLRLSNIVLTPHVGGSTPAALAAMADGAARNILNFLRGETIDAAACVNPQVLAPSSMTESIR